MEVAAPTLDRYTENSTVDDKLHVRKLERNYSAALHSETCKCMQFYYRTKPYHNLNFSSDDW